MSESRHLRPFIKNTFGENSYMRKILLFSVVLFQCVLLMAQDAPKGLNVNDKAPDFVAKDQDGKSVHLQDRLKKGAVVVVFYRGQWCPYCNRELKKLEDSLSLIMSKGATLVAVTPEKPDNITKTITKTKATYPILFDDGLKIMKSYDVAYAVEGDMLAKYKSYGIDFTEANGSNGAYLPVPAVYVIGKDGRIVYRHFDPDFRNRANVKDILDHL